jgi:hypothetical protein
MHDEASKDPRRLRALSATIAALRAEIDIFEDELRLLHWCGRPASNREVIAAVGTLRELAQATRAVYEDARILYGPEPRTTAPVRAA